MPLGTPCTEMLGGCLVFGGHWMSAITLTPGWCQWESPCGLELPTERLLPLPRDWGKLGGHSTGVGLRLETKENQEGT